MQPTSDDASHDEALSGRVAALNMLDLGLEHLDIVVGDLAPELNLVVKACGESENILLTQSFSRRRLPDGCTNFYYSSNTIGRRMPIAWRQGSGSRRRTQGCSR